MKSTTIPITGEGDRIIGLLSMNFYTNLPLTDILAKFMPVHSNLHLKDDVAETFSLGAFAALRVFSTSYIGSAVIIPSVYRSMVLTNSLFSLQQSNFAMLWAPLVDQRLRPPFIRRVIIV